MVLHDCGVSILAKLSVNTVAIRRQLSVLRSVMKYQPVDNYDLIYCYADLLCYFILLLDPGTAATAAAVKASDRNQPLS